MRVPSLYPCDLWLCQADNKHCPCNGCMRLTEAGLHEMQLSKCGGRGDVICRMV
jgi:hypothetical protein